jgi:hypothetical protein
VSYEDLKKRDPGFIAAYEEQTAGARSQETRVRSSMTNEK